MMDSPFKMPDFSKPEGKKEEPKVEHVDATQKDFKVPIHVKKEDAPKEVKVNSPKLSRREMMLAEKARILEEHGGLTSNIPLTHKYWKMR